MARRGRKRKTGNRVNGRLVQISEAQRERDVKQTVIDQPHRQGSDSQMRESAVGRLIMDCWQTEWWPDERLQPEWSANDLYTAAQRYGEAWADVQKVISSKRPYANETRLLGSEHRSDEEVEGWRNRVLARWTEISNVVGGPESIRRKAAEFVIIDNPGPDWSPPFWVRHSMKVALVSLASHCLGGGRKAA